MKKGLRLTYHTGVYLFMHQPEALVGGGGGLILEIQKQYKMIYRTALSLYCCCRDEDHHGPGVTIEPYHRNGVAKIHLW